ncbi:hypothetical protein ACFOD4_13825 [Pseudoroseomonas globiformis]|uniref:Flagellar FliJ protein n=1 Tax=Teichococcus globiformis TaxID=2307229 RepID=A0ABV7G544_9PROT
MQALPLLIRLARRQADARRVALSEAELAVREAGQRLATHEALTAAETARASGNASEMAAWVHWSRRSARETRQLDHAYAVLAAREAEIRAALTEDFAETKRLEIALEARRREAAKHAARKTEKLAEDVELRRPRAG